jgi:uncharacterized protein YodC (DUF2158 family)
MVTKRELENFVASEEAVELGKVVFLRSGGQAMTVRSITRSGVVCEWFDRTGRLRSQEFLLHSLTGRQPTPNGKPRGIVVIGNLDPEHAEKNEH